MKIERFENIIAWQKGKDLIVEIYKLFKNNRDFSFVDQIKRASVSICNNIAEGFERKSNNELRHFLFIAKGSSGEVRSMLYIAKDLRYINEKDFESKSGLALEVSKILSGLIKTL